MFQKIRYHLTLFYTALIAFFLLIFTVIIYFLVSSVIYFEQKEEVQHLIVQEVQEHSYELQLWSEGMIDMRRYVEYEPERNTFYYVVDAEGEIIYGDEMLPDLHQDIMHSLKDWVPDPEKVSFKKFKINHDENFYVALTGQEIYNQEEFLGVIYAGINITPQRTVLEWLMLLLVMLAVVFVILSTLLAYYMAGKAMVPISKSFQRQREFVADASHELRTPLSVLQAAIEVIEYEDGQRLSTLSKEIIKDTKDELQRMTHLIQDLLTLARSDSGTLDLDLEKFNLVPLVHQLVRSLSPLINDKKLSFVQDIPDDIYIFADRDRITQLIYILLDNAIKYTPEQGEISLSMRVLQEENLEVTVQDSGVGISDEQQEHIFERFYRADQGRTRAGEEGGSGLGLAIASWIVDSHQGSIKLHSQLGVGSKFTVMLPLAREA